MDLEGGTHKVVQGTCPIMCPITELRLRERERLLHPFEIREEDRLSAKPRADPQRAVKEYSRPAAGRADPRPADVRPGPVLLQTVHYLLTSVVTRTDKDWLTVYDFVFDRLRAVRQDSAMQALSGQHMVTLLENIVRFHVYAGYRLCEQEIPAGNYDPFINDQHLLDCLKQLLRLYQNTPNDHHHQNTHLHSQKDTPYPHQNTQHSQTQPHPQDAPHPHPARPLMEAVYLLHSCGSLESVAHGLSLPASVRDTSLVRDALAINMAYLQGNVVRFFRLALRLTTTSPLCVCAVHRHFHTMRLHSLRVMSVAYSSKACQFPVATLHRWLCVDSAVIREMLNACGLLPDKDMHSAQHVNFLKTKFSAPDKVPRHRQSELTSQLDTMDIAALLKGDHSPNS